MMEKEWVFVRHGETELNRLGIVQGSGVDTDLNAAGHRQAMLLYRKYGTPPFDLVITSRLKRTHQTVTPFLETGIPWIQTTLIDEISWGEHEGQPGTAEHIARYDAMIRSWARGDLHASLPGGESAHSLIDRVDRFIMDLRSKVEKRILICTHGRTLRCLITRLKGGAPSDMEKVTHANTGVFRVRWVSGITTVLSENDLTHLHEPG